MAGVRTYFSFRKGQAVNFFIRNHRIEASRNPKAFFYENFRPPILSRRRQDHPSASGHEKLLFSM
jgi:hypothetical protein